MPRSLGLRACSQQPCGLARPLRPRNKLSACVEYRSRVLPILAGPLKLSMPRPLHPAPHVWGARLVWAQSRMARAIMAHLRRIVVTGRAEHCSPRGWGAWPRALIATRTSQNAREAGLATCSARAGSQLGCATTTNLAHLWVLLRHRLAVYPGYGVRCHMRDG